MTSAITIAAAAVVGAGAAVYSSTQQSKATKNAQNIAQSQYQKTVTAESPYTQAGSAAQDKLNYLLGTGATNSDGTVSSATSANPGGDSGGSYGSLLSPFTADMMKQYSPAYQFQLQQGQQNVLNGAASGQGALSGAALTDLTNYNQSAANTAFASANNIYQQQQTNIYQRLADTANRGQSAASNTAVAGTAAASSAAQSATNTGTAQASGTTSAVNALTSGATNASIWAQVGGGGTPNNASSAGGTTSGAAYDYLYSDRRLKKNIRRIGTTAGGQAWYEFEYTGLPGIRTGVMADESPPSAVVHDAAGYAMVDYSRIL